MYEWDETKSQETLETRGFDFTIVHGFDWNSALVIEDTRQDYGERRFRALGFVDDRLFALVFTIRSGHIRVISLRKANAREVKRYARR